MFCGGYFGEILSCDSVITLKEHAVASDLVLLEWFDGTCFFPPCTDIRCWILVLYLITFYLWIASEQDGPFPFEFISNYAYFYY